MRLSATSLVAPALHTQQNRRQHRSVVACGRAIQPTRRFCVMGKCLPVIVATIAIVVTQVSPGHGYEAVTVTNGGAVEGKITFTGPKPPARKVIPTKDQDFCGGVREVEQIQLSPDKGVDEVVVWVKQVAKGKAWEKPATPPALMNTHCDFTPFVQAVPVNTEIELINNDAVFHNLHSFLDKATVHNVSLPKNGRRIRRTFTEPGLVSVECESHSRMEAWV